MNKTDPIGNNIDFSRFYFVDAVDETLEKPDLLELDSDAKRAKNSKNYFPSSDAKFAPLLGNLELILNKTHLFFEKLAKGASNNWKSSLDEVLLELGIASRG